MALPLQGGISFGEEPLNSTHRGAGEDEQPPDRAARALLWASGAGSAVKAKLVTALHHAYISAVWAEEPLPLCKAFEVLLRFMALPSTHSAGLQKGPGLRWKPCTGFNQVFIIHAHIYFYFSSSLETPWLFCLLNRTFSSPVEVGRALGCTLCSFGGQGEGGDPLLCSPCWVRWQGWERLLHTKAGQGIMASASNEAETLCCLCALTQAPSSTALSCSLPGSKLCLFELLCGFCPSVGKDATSHRGGKGGSSRSVKHKVNK